MPYVMISRAERILLLFGVGNTNKINKNKQKYIKTLKIGSIHAVLDIVWIKVRSKHEKKKLPLKLDTTGNVERER